MSRTLRLVESLPSVVSLPANLDDAPRVYAAQLEIEALARTGSAEVIVDCSAVATFSGPVVGWLTCAASALREAGGRLVLRRVRPDLAAAINDLARSRRLDASRSRPAA